MSLFMLAVGKNGNTGNIEELIVGTMPWAGVRRVPINYIESHGIELDNIRVFNNQLVNKGMDYRRYTLYETNKSVIINRSYYILARSVNHKGKVYFVTDGICIPFWASVFEVQQRILHDGTRLANVKIVETDNGVYFSSIKGEIPEVDYNETCLQLRNYLKKAQGVQT